MKSKKAVIFVVILLFVVPFLYSAIGDSCANEGQIDQSTNAICSLGVWEPPSATIYRIQAADEYEVVYSANWYACNADPSDSPVAGITLSKGQRLVINNKEYICYLENDIEKISKCDLTNMGSRILIDSQYYYCDADSKWKTGLSAQEACVAADALYGGISWTGRNCCGEQLDLEYYNERLGTSGCWASHVVRSGNIVSEVDIAPDFTDNNGDSIPDKWQKINTPISGSSGLQQGAYEIYVGEQIDSFHGLKSSDIRVRKNAEYNLSIDTRTNFLPNDGQFYALNLECYGDGTNNDFSWLNAPQPIATTQDWTTLSAIFKTTSTTTYCQIFPRLYSSGIVWFNNIKMHEDNPYVLNHQGEFFVCEKTNTYFNINILNENYNYVCGSLGNYYCSSDGWVYTTLTGLHSSRIIPGANLLINPFFEIR